MIPLNQCFNHSQISAVNGPVCKIHWCLGVRSLVSPSPEVTRARICPFRDIGETWHERIHSLCTYKGFIQMNENTTTLSGDYTLMKHNYEY